MQLKHFERGQVLFREGEVGREAYRIVSGHVEITITEGAKTTNLGILYPGEIVGEMAMIEDKPRAATVRALTATVVEVITEENFIDAVIRDPERLKAYLVTLFERLRGMGVRLRHALRNNVALSEQLNHAGDGETWPGDLGAGGVESAATLTLHTVQSGEPIEMQVETFPFRIGRRLPSSVASIFAANDFAVDDEPPHQVSRHHCAIERTAKGFVVADRGSKLGTIVNGIAIGEASTRMTAPLRRGENIVVLGSAESRVRLKLIV
ncbi:MAG: cyclic nucleotide-binding domain-containing protein, partial [Verrucomicrobiales bacterium]|nr:cyclic nucleotide-binding domain-containing protein [Verrucomicrobiales bacterium]